MMDQESMATVVEALAQESRCGTDYELYAARFSVAVDAWLAALPLSLRAAAEAVALGHDDYFPPEKRGGRDA